MPLSGRGGMGSCSNRRFMGLRRLIFLWSGHGRLAMSQGKRQAFRAHSAWMCLVIQVAYFLVSSLSLCPPLRLSVAHPAHSPVSRYVFFSVDSAEPRTRTVFCWTRPNQDLGKFTVEKSADQATDSVAQSGASFKTLGMQAARTLAWLVHVYTDVRKASGPNSLVCIYTG